MVTAPRAWDMSTHRARQETRPSTELAGFVADLDFEGVPADGRRLAERCVVDTVGVALAGSVEGTAAAARRATGGSGGPSRVLGRDENRAPPAAAFVNGTAGHALDYDDVCWAMSGHPSVTLVPAALAVGDLVDAAGRELVTAFVAGFETLAYLGRPILPDHYELGWHPTSTLGTFGAAATAAALLGLDADETAHALNAAASMPAGLKRNFGTATKPVHAGHAARSGVSAALLAAEGITADRRAIVGDQGFFERYSSEGADPDAIPDLGEQWAVVEDGVGVKKFPCCYFTHAGIEAAARLADRHDLAPEDVERVEVRASPGAGDALHHADPSTGLEAKFSMEYTVAAGIVRDRVGLDAFEDAAVDEPDVDRVRERVDFAVDESLAYNDHETAVAVDTVGGEHHALTLEAPPGTHDDPLSDGALEAKFLECATRVLEQDTAEAAYGRLDALREQPSVDAAFERL